MTTAKTADLDDLSHEIDAGALRPAPTEVLGLDRFAEAFDRAESGGLIGKVVLRLTDDN